MRETDVDKSVSLFGVGLLLLFTFRALVALVAFVDGSQKPEPTRALFGAQNQNRTAANEARKKAPPRDLFRINLLSQQFGYWINFHLIALNIVFTA